MLVRIEKKLPRPENSETTTVRLVLQTGSRAGMQAPLQHGYYMIGRHKECQIRPKSRSVSRYHCLLQNDGGAVRVLDLDSSSGTRINEEKLTPKSWLPLNDGDLLRCGKIVFRVNVEVVERKSAAKALATVGAAADGESMLASEAWQEVDIANYLGSEDEADRERRYESIRERHDSRQSLADSDSDIHIFGEDFEDDSPTIASAGVAAGSFTAGTSSIDLPGKKRSAASVNEDSPAEPKRTRPVRPPKQERKRHPRVGPSRFHWAADTERVKMIGAITLTIVTLAYVGYSAYSYYNGPQVRVLEGID